MKLPLLQGQVASAASLAALAIATTGALADGLLWGAVAFERDTTAFYYPLAAWSWQQLHGVGKIPLWTPQIFGGYPIFADGEHGLASPLVLLAMLLMPADAALIALRLVHLLVAAFGTYALARAWRLSHTASVLGGATFALGSFLAAQIHHENVIRSAVWLPLGLALLERSLRSQGRLRLRWILLASGCVTMAALGLHAQIVFMDLLAMATYGVLRLGIGPIRGAGRRLLPRAITLLLVLPVLPLLGLMLAAVQLAPFLELAGISWRGAGLPYSVAASHSLTWYGLIKLIFPYFFRGPGEFEWGLWSPWESTLYVGLIPLALALLAIVGTRRPAVRFWAVLGSLGLVMALGQYSPLNLHQLLWLLPGLNGLRAPGRFTLVVVLALGMLAAHGLDWLERRARTSPAPLGPAPRRLLWGLFLLPALLTPVFAIAHAVLLAWPEATTAFLENIYLTLPRDAQPLWSADVHRGMKAATDLTSYRVFLPLIGLVVTAGLLMAWQVVPRPDHGRWCRVLTCADGRDGRPC
jgi:hypothetical protein